MALAAGMAQADVALFVDQKRLRQAIDPPIDRRAPVRIGTNRGIRVAELAQKAERIGRFVAFVDAYGCDSHCHRRHREIQIGA